MNYCIKCGKLIDDYSLMCEDCTVSNSPWLLALKNKDADLSEQITQLKAENAELRERMRKAAEELEIIKGLIESRTYAVKTGLGFIVEWCTLEKHRELYGTEEAAEARLKELKGEQK